MTSFKEKIRPALNGIDQKIKIYEENKAVKDKNDSFPNNLSTTTGYKVFRDNIEFPETNAEEKQESKVFNDFTKRFICIMFNIVCNCNYFL